MACRGMVRDMEPCCGRTIPSSNFTSVLFPQPFGPMRAMKSALPIVTVMFSSIGRPLL